MSVIVKGMEMPESCSNCELCACYAESKGEVYRCDITMYPVRYFEKRMNNCPLVEVPTPHGDLIERDYVKNIIKNFSTAWEYGDGVSDCWNALVTAPTIIEAEDGE